MTGAVEKAYAYATRPADGARELLVFEHRDHDAAVQVPGGTVEDGESPRETAVRELAEETGVTAIDSVDPLVTARWRPPERDVVHRRQFVHVETTEDRDRWTHAVSAGAADEGLAFECYWVPVGEATIDHGMDVGLDALG